MLAKKCKKYSGKLWFKGQLQADSFLFKLIFTLPSHISQGDSLTLFRMGFFGAAHESGGAFLPHSLKSVTHIL